MTARDIVERLHGDGVDLSIDGDQLDVKATLAPLKPDTVAELNRHKTAILSLLRSCPAYDHDTQLELCAWQSKRPRSERLRMHRRSIFLRNEDDIPFHIAFCLSIESERDDFNPRVMLCTPDCDAASRPSQRGQSDGGVSLSVSYSTGTPHGTTRVPALARAEAEQSEIWDNSSEEARQ